MGKIIRATRYVLIEQIGDIIAESIEDAKEKFDRLGDDALEYGHMELVDETTEYGPLVFRELRGDYSYDDPPPLESVSKLREQVRILREALEANKLRMEIAAEYLHRFQGACAYHGDQLVRAIKAANIALETTKEQS